MSRKYKSSKLRLKGVSTVRQFTASVVVGILVSISFTLYSHFQTSSTNWDILNAKNLSAFTTPFGLMFSLLSIFKDFGNRPRKVKILMPSTSDYQSAIINGFELTLGKLSKNVIEFEDITPRMHHRDEKAQIEILRSLRSEKVDALVIMPARLSKALLEELRLLYFREVFIVILEYNPPKEVFNKAHLRAPYVIAPDFYLCGEILGNECIKLLQEDSKSKVINVISPIGEWENNQGIDIQKATSNIFARAGVVDKVVEIRLQSWDSKIASSLILTQIHRISLSTTGSIIVSCGTDRILIQLWTALFNDDYNNIRDRIKLIGFDGIRDFRGELIVNLCVNAVGTIDTKPLEIGIHAAQLILDEASGNLQIESGEVQIHPQFTNI